MVLSIGNFPKVKMFAQRKLGKVATARGYDARVCQNRQPVLFHSHPGQVYGVGSPHTIVISQSVLWSGKVDSSLGLPSMV